jgi:outer membrane protein W
MRKIVITAAVAALGATFAGTAMADDAKGPSSGVEVGLRAGYGIPLGSAEGAPAGGQASAMSDSFSGMIPIQIDALYMINPNIRVGLYFQYGLVSLADKFAGGVCKASGVSCSAHDLRYGVQAHYHIMPENQIDPWVGLGIGMESVSGSASAGGQSIDFGVSGLEFLNIQAGADYKVMPNLGVGPFVNFSLGQYSSATQNGQSADIQNKAMHEWLIIGVRGAYDIGF